MRNLLWEILLSEHTTADKELIMDEPDAFLLFISFSALEISFALKSPYSSVLRVGAFQIVEGF